MFKNRFSLETAYVTGSRIVVNHFSFFLLTMGVGFFSCTGFLALLGLLDFFAFKHHLVRIFKVFQNAAHAATGPLHYVGLRVRDMVSPYLPSDLMEHVFGSDAVSFDISEYDIMYILTWLVPTALILTAVLAVISVGWTKIALDLKANKTVTAHYLYQFYYLVPRVMVVNLVVFFATIFGLILFVLPGIFVHQRLRFAKYFIIDKNLSILKALQSSWAITEGSVLQLSGFSVIELLLNSIGRVIFLVRLFTMPLQYQVEANVYLQLVK